jgi:putative transposase
MPQHVIQRGNNRSVTFVADSDYRFFLDILRAACERHGCRVHAYVLMTNHVHLLMTPSTKFGISAVMQSVGRRYVRCFNDNHERTGTLWEGRYKATVVDTEHYLLGCYRYIELNPVRGGLVTDPRNYRWSSYRANALGVVDSLVTPHECYDALGVDPPSRQLAYRALVGAVLPAETLDEIRSATNAGWALGSKQFRDEVATLLARRTQPAIRGPRPRRKDVIRL